MTRVASPRRVHQSKVLAVSTLAILVACTRAPVTPASTSPPPASRAAIAVPSGSARAQVLPPLDCNSEWTEEYPSSRCAFVVRASLHTECIPSALFRRHGCLVLDADATLCADGAYDMTVLLEANDVVLRGRGAIVDHGWTPGAQRHPGIRAPKTRSLSGIRIEDLSIRRTGFAAVELMRHFRGSELDEETRGHTNITVDQVRTWDASFGVYVGVGAEDIRVSNVEVVASRDVGVYVDSNATRFHLLHSLVSDTLGREGVALDSTTHALVEGNVFRRNAGGGVRTYHNCGELLGVVCPIRRGPSSGHVIRENRFEDGLFIASRQAQRYDAGWCADLAAEAGVAVDESRGLVIEENVFVHNGRWASLKIQDGPNVVRRNRFVRGSGSPMTRDCVGIHVSHGPFDGNVPIVVEGVLIEENVLDGCTVHVQDHPAVRALLRGNVDPTGQRVPFVEDSNPTQEASVE